MKNLFILTSLITTIGAIQNPVSAHYCGYGGCPIEHEEPCYHAGHGGSHPHATLEYCYPCEFEDYEQEEDDEQEACLTMMRYVKAGAKYYNRFDIVWPSLGIGWRAHKHHFGYDTSLTLTAPAAEGRMLKNLLNFNLKGLALYYSAPYSWASLYTGIGLGIDYITWHSYTNTSMTAELAMGYEFPTSCFSRSFIQAEFSQPFVGRNGVKWYEGSAISLSMGAGF